MTEAGFAIEIQRAKGYERTLFNSEAPGFLFLRPDSKSTCWKTETGCL